MLKYLFKEKGLDPMMKDNSGRTPLHIAVQLKNKQMALIILKEGCEKAQGIRLKQRDLMKAKDDKGMRPFDYIDNNVGLLSFLELKGVCVHMTN
mmetsp:Transcript_40995/g.39531  ORF Transcript_40995/g.39531 Transcript_40995/m.39531 type:complete len:94 (-) Transcript_40995:173-454(-)